MSSWIKLRLAVGLILCIKAFELVGMPQSQMAQPQGEIANNKALVQRWIEEGFNNRNSKVVDELFSATFEINGRTISREDLKQSMQTRLTAFPDLQVTIEESIAEGKLVGIWYRAKGTHKGNFEGFAATGRQVTWAGSDLFRIEKGKIVQALFVDDSLGLMRQLGAQLVLPTDKQ